MQASITIDRLTKYYGSAEAAAINELTLQVKAGEIYGFLGANGAGKTTAIRLLLNLLQPSSGTATIVGLDVARDSVAIKKHVGYLAGDISLYPKPTGRQLLDYLSALNTATSYRSTLEKRFKPDLDKPIGSLSRGNRQKIGIIQAFMTSPDVLILDEPTSGLDPLMQEAFYTTVLESKQRGAAVLMSSHNLTEAERICDTIGIIRHGKLVHEQALVKGTTLGTIIFKVTFAKPSDLTLCKTAEGLTFVSQTDSHNAVFKPAGSIAAALKTLSRFDIKELNTRTVDLEDEFLEFYGDTE